MARKSKFIAMGVGKDAAVDPKRMYRVVVEMKPGETVRDLKGFKLDYCCMPQSREIVAGKSRLHAYSSGAAIAAIRKAGRPVEVLADAEEEGKRMQKFVSKTNRFAGGAHPQGVGVLI
jgi:hypothetical protein